MVITKMFYLFSLDSYCDKKKTVQGLYSLLSGQSDTFGTDRTNSMPRRQASRQHCTRAQGYTKSAKPS